MKYRGKVALALGTAAIVPLLVLGFGVRREMSARLDALAAGRGAALAAVLRADLDQEAETLRRRLRTLAAGLAQDNRFRLALRGGEAERRWLLDWAGGVMAPSGLAVLRVQDGEGRVLSSGHFRNEYDRIDAGLPAALAGAAGQGVLVRLAGPDSAILVRAALDSFRVAERVYRIVGGVPFDAARAAALVPRGELAVSLEFGPAGEPSPASELRLPYYDATGGGPAATARLIIRPDPSPRRQLQNSVNRWFAAAAGLTLLLALALAGWLSSRVSRPLAELAQKTARLDLDRLDENFSSDRDDEIGALGNLLAAMTDRLRSSSTRLREAERRAATGDLARQINHDVKNGLAPIRHVLRHLSETAQREPARLAAVFGERRETLESSVSYLEELARNYARLAPVPDRTPSDLGGLLQEVARGARTDDVEVEVRVASDLPPVRADALVLRRIMENLVSNAVEALGGGPGRVTLASELMRNGPEPRVRVAVSDTGRGMTREELDRAFDDFHTTKPAGTGLGLSVVRRLVGDLGGSLRVDTRPGQGSTFTVEIPVA